MRFLTALFVIVACLQLGCGAPPKVVLPPGVTCTQTVNAGPGSESLGAALAKAPSGTCVVAAAGTYDGEFSVPAGVLLGAGPGAVVELTGVSAGPAAITLAKGASLSGLRVKSKSKVGIFMNGGGHHLVSVEVTDAPGTGIVSWCEEDCRTADLTVLRDLKVTNNEVGLWVHGARVQTVGGTISGSKSFALASGYGVVASHGAALDMSGTRVEGNEELGVLVDGAMGTEATLTEVSVVDNKGRGVWAQSIAGTMAAPKLKLVDCTVEGNRLVGVGARNSRGISVQGGSISKTIVAKAASNMMGVLVDVGDGVGLFESTGDVRVNKVKLDNNGRSQVLVDTGATGLEVSESTLTPQSGQLGVVVQRTAATVQAPMIHVPMMGQELQVSAPTQGLPTR